MQSFSRLLIDYRISASEPVAWKQLVGYGNNMNGTRDGGSILDQANSVHPKVTSPPPPPLSLLDPTVVFSKILDKAFAAVRVHVYMKSLPVSVLHALI